MATPKGQKETKPQEEKKHPDQWEQDLNPHRMEGQNIGRQNSRDLDLRAAAAIKELTECLGNFREDELAQIPIIPEGGRLQQGAVYLDLRDAASGPFAATGDMVAQKHNIYVAKNKTPYQYWNRLLGVFCPRAAGAASTGENAGTELSEELVDKTLQDSFPASDPPSWTTGRDPEQQKL